MNNTIFIASSIDDNYAMAFATTVQSVLSNKKKDTKIEWFVLDVGISRGNMHRIQKSFESEDIFINWLYPKENVFLEIRPKGHITMATYYRILLFNLIPCAIKKIIYLDADLLVLRGIEELWDCSFNNKTLCAVQDQVVPFVDSKIGLRKYHEVAPYLASRIGVANYDILGIPPDKKYFNAGVMIINLLKWRLDRIEQKILEFLNSNIETNLFFDQDGFNAVLFSDWQELDLRWNQVSLFYRYPSWDKSPYDKETYNKILNDAYIIHFVSIDKPWYFRNKHINRKLFFKYLDKTAWKGWRPSILKTFLKKIPIYVRHSVYVYKHKVDTSNGHHCFRSFLGILALCKLSFLKVCQLTWKTEQK